MEDSNASPRMSTEHENTEMHPFECMFKHFKTQKVAISNAIRSTFPFLESLRDREFITGKMYEDLIDSCRSLVPVDKVIYKALDELEKKFDVTVLWELFNEVNMEKYPDLNPIRRSFECVFPNELCFQGIDRGNPNSQLSLEQGPSASYSQGSLNGSSLDLSSSEGWRSNDRRNSNLMQANQTENHQLAESPGHLDSCELQVQLNNGDATPESYSLLPQHEENVKKENSSFSLAGNQQTRARTNQNEDSEVIELSSGDSDDGENFSEATTTIPSQPAPAYSRTPPTLRTDRRGDTSDTESSIIIRRRKRTGRKKRERLGSYLIRNIKIPMKTSWKTAVLARSANTSSQRRRKRGPRIPREENADFGGAELPVVCGNVQGFLNKEKFKQGIYSRSIRSETGRLFTPMDFEIEGNCEKAKNWRQSIRCKGWTLRELIQKGVLQDPPRKKKENPRNPRQMKRQPGNPKACKVCGQPRKVHPCTACKEFYHKNCHIPPVEDKSSSWHCAFCKRKNQLRGQKTQACHKEAEVLKRKMSPEEQQKCELLLLTIYCYSKSAFFILKPKQRKEKFPDLREHMWLNKIKNRLNKKAYHSVQRFVEDMRLIFHNHSIFYKSRFKNLGIRVRNKFEKNFKRIFSIEDTSEHEPCNHTVLLT
ncbi:nuclear autoantigen Sp-100 isoform X4 [Mus caroli]|uniref:Nuclear autoantigen Sp-100 isoform X4 n=1 Tax=Mus caroli TaxID=10089 RepID=A0A6P7QNT0_MUSCR|nr:nuclear autoantigen Sp-100 isoform X4 [Mus caroli]